LGEHDVRVAVTHCGLCHTDIHAIDDYYGITNYPFVAGHEIVGHVSEVGREASDLKEGDRVGIGWQGRSCMKCEWCLQGQEHLCQDIVRSGTWVPYGGFSSSVVVHNHFAYPLPDGMPSEVGSVLVCAGISVYSPLRAYATQASQRVGVIGVGGLGHLAIQFARTLGYEVTAISHSPDKRDEAIGFGAHHFIAADDRAALRQAEFGLDMLLCTTPGDMHWESLLETLRKNGRLVLVGFPRVSLDPIDLVVRQLSITGSFLGNHASLREMLAVAQSSGIAPRIELMPMSQVNAAIQRVRENKARYRIVLVNEAVGARDTDAGM
jgi:uncharacterized zinc-type alcohol dehydrogenase-like protein